MGPGEGAPWAPLAEEGLGLLDHLADVGAHEVGLEGPLDEPELLQPPVQPHVEHHPWGTGGGGGGVRGPYGSSFPAENYSSFFPF